MEIERETFADVYQALAKEIIENGQKVYPREMETKELLHQTFIIDKPWMNLAYIPGRDFSLMYAFVESILLVGSSNSLDYYTAINPRMANYSDDGKTLHGAYGHRIAENISDIIALLEHDTDTRQAVLNIYSAKQDLVPTKDVPCTMSLHFMIRNGKLDLHVYMRSNDIIWGTPYDVFMFTNLQMVIANQLEIPVGKYYHTATSLHAYSNMYEVLENIANNKPQPTGHYNLNNYVFWYRCYLKYIRMVCYTKIGIDIRKEEIDGWDDDGSYLLALMIELKYRKYKETKDKQFLQEINNLVSDMRKKPKYSWLENFTKRWDRI